MTKRKIEYWVIPPDQDAEFVADMENVLETYAEAYDPQQPVLCMDEQPVQLLKETKVPIAATKKHAKRVDYEYERNGTASIFMFAEPLSGFRQATARERRTKVDWAIEVAQLLDTRYAACAKVTLVCDNLNTHTKGAFYTAFPPEQARAYIKRINFCHTPKHGSWLNIAECELSCLTSQCLSDRRIGELPLLQSEIGIWADKTNAKQRGVDWQFKIDDARTKLKRLYPKRSALAADDPSAAQPSARADLCAGPRASPDHAGRPAPLARASGWSHSSCQSLKTPCLRRLKPQTRPAQPTTTARSRKPLKR